MKTIGIIPARMAASRFPGKPMHPICGRPMIEHVYRRAALFKDWDWLCLATCDEEIAAFGKSKGWPVVMTSDRHERALDRVAEAAEKCGQKIEKEDLVVCVQGDEPMLYPDMMSAATAPFRGDPSVACTVLAMEIHEENIFLNPNTLKIIHDMKGDVLYTSRAPVPYCKKFSPALGVRRIYGIFGFRLGFLRTFTGLPPSPLEKVEACDSNRIMDHGFRQRIAPYPFRPSFSVDTVEDIKRVEEYMPKDPLFGKY